MNPNPPKFRAFLVLVAATPVVELLAGTSLSVTYINTGYLLFVALVGLLVTREGGRFWPGFRHWLLLPFVYVVIFFVVTYFGEDFEYALRYRANLMPLLLVNFFVWYVAGFYFDERIFARFLVIGAVIFAVGSIVFSMVDLLDAEKTRVIFGVDVPLAVAASLLSNHVVATVVLTMSAVASLKKTVVICVAMAFLTVFAFKNFAGAPGWGKTEGGKGRFYIAVALATVLSVPLFGLMSELIEDTLARLLNEREDVVRLAMTEEFFHLLNEHFPFGIGFYMFGYYTSSFLEYTTFTAQGLELADGMSLHNTFMHILLEGGAIVALVAIAIYFRAIAGAVHMFSYPPARGAAILILSWLIVSVLFGMFNQLHATRYFFGIFGFAFGCYQRYRPLLHKDVPPRVTYGMLGARG